MKKIMKRVVTGLLTLVLAVGFTGCGSKSSTDESTDNSQKKATSSEKKNNVTLRFGATGWKQYELLLAESGLNDFDGYTVEYSLFQGGNLCLEALAADEIDFTLTSEIPPIAASLADNGGNFKIVLINSSSPQNQELVALKSSGIKKVADLKGKKVGYVKNTTAQYFLNKMLEEAGLTWKDIIPVEVTTADGVTALVNGDIDAFASYGNSINSAKNNGAITLDTAVTILSGNFPVEVSKTTLADEAKTEAIADYLARVQKAFEWQEKHLEQWSKIQAEPTGMSTEDTLNLLQRTYDDRGYVAKYYAIDDKIIASEQSVADTFYQLGVLDKQVDVSSFYEKSFGALYEKALKNIQSKK